MPKVAFTDFERDIPAGSDYRKWKALTLAAPGRGKGSAPGRDVPRQSVGHRPRGAVDPRERHAGAAVRDRAHLRHRRHYGTEVLHGHGPALITAVAPPVSPVASRRGRSLAGRL